MTFDYSRIYLKWHSDTPEHVQLMVKFYSELLAAHLTPDRKASILDVGCGMGFTLLTLQHLGYEDVSGVESDRAQADSCKAKGLNVDLTSDTKAYLKERPSKFTTILALDLIEHIPVSQQLEFVNALATALVPGGRLICTVPNANSVLASRWRYICWTHQTSFTEHSLDFLLYNGGFGDIRIQGYEFNKRPRNVWLPVSGARHWWAFRFFRLFRRLQMMAELGPAQGREVPLSLNLLGVARKT